MTAGDMGRRRGMRKAELMDSLSVVISTNAFGRLATTFHLVKRAFDQLEQFCNLRRCPAPPHVPPLLRTP